MVVQRPATMSVVFCRLYKESRGKMAVVVVQAPLTPFAPSPGVASLTGAASVVDKKREMKDASESKYNAEEHMIEKECKQ